MSLASNLPNQQQSWFVLSRGKPMSHHSLSRIWKQDGWIRRLSGLMLEPSMASHGAAKLIASRLDTPASRLASQDASEPTKTHGICGHTLPASSVKSNPSGASSKMFPTIYRWDLNRSVMTWATWVTRLRQACLARPRAFARKTKNYGCACHQKKRALARAWALFKS